MEEKLQALLEQIVTLKIRRHTLCGRLLKSTSKVYPYIVCGGETYAFSSEEVSRVEGNTIYLQNPIVS